MTFRVGQRVRYVGFAVHSNAESREYSRAWGFIGKSDVAKPGDIVTVVGFGAATWGEHADMMASAGSPEGSPVVHVQQENGRKSAGPFSHYETIGDDAAEWDESVSETLDRTIRDLCSSGLMRRTGQRVNG